MSGCFLTSVIISQPVSCLVAYSEWRVGGAETGPQRAAQACARGVGPPCSLLFLPSGRATALGFIFAGFMTSLSPAAPSLSSDRSCVKGAPSPPALPPVAVFQGLDITPPFSRKSPICVFFKHFFFDCEGACLSYSLPSLPPFPFIFPPILPSLVLEMGPEALTLSYVPTPFSVILRQVLAKVCDSDL